MHENRIDPNNNYSSPVNTSVRRLWLGFILSPIIWAVYFVVLYVIDEAACQLSILSPSAVLPLATILGLITLGVIGIAVRYAYQALRQSEEGGNSYFMGWTGLLLGGLFALSTVAIGASAWFLMPC